MAHLRGVRLARAHEDLGSGEWTVAEVANRWGFGHLSRFAAAYRNEYGVSPSTTLRTGGAAAVPGRAGHRRPGVLSPRG